MLVGVILLQTCPHTTRLNEFQSSLSKQSLRSLLVSLLNSHYATATNVSTKLHLRLTPAGNRGADQAGRRGPHLPGIENATWLRWCEERL